jgi:hypothetical protein
MVDPVGRWVVLSDHEQQACKDGVRFFDTEADERVRAGPQPTRRRTRESRGQDELAVGGACVAIMLVFVDAPVAGLAVGGATALGWLFWRFWPLASTEATVCQRVGAQAGVPATAPLATADQTLPKRRPGRVARSWTGRREGGER